MSFFLSVVARGRRRIQSVGARAGITSQNEALVYIHYTVYSNCKCSTLTIYSIDIMYIVSILYRMYTVNVKARDF